MTGVALSGVARSRGRTGARGDRPVGRTRQRGWVAPLFGFEVLRRASAARRRLVRSGLPHVLPAYPLAGRCPNNRHDVTLSVLTATMSHRDG